MGKWMMKLIASGLCAFLASCAIITVNVYFPEKDVKQAYKSLDDMLLKPGGEAKPAGGEPAGGGGKKEEVKPQSLLFPEQFRISLVSEAIAAEPLADELAIEISSMPEVLKAYDEMRGRIPQLNKLRDSGAIGVNKQGLIVIRDRSKIAGLDALVKQENDNRKTIISSMAKAVVKNGKKTQPNANFDYNQTMKQAADMYAETKREEAKPGWWIELPNGNWVQK